MEHRARFADVLVVGAGIAGAATAVRLARDGHRVTMVAPRADPLAASDAAGAMLGALGEITAEPASARERLDADLRVAAARRWDGWHAELSEMTQAPPLHRGTFMLAGARRPADRVALDAVAAAALRAGLPVERVDPSDVPGLAPVPGHEPVRAIFLPREGWIDARALLGSLHAVVEASDRVQRVDDVVDRLVVVEGRVTGASTRRHGELAADAVVLCAGSRTDAVLQATPDLRALVPRVIPAKGVALVLEPPPRLFEPSAFSAAIRTPNREFACGLHVLPQGDGVYLGATNRVTRWPGITGEVTASEIVRLLNSATRELFDGFQRWNLVTTVYGERPLVADGLPIAGRTPVDALLIATGAYRNGVLLAPLMADIIAQALAGEDGDRTLAVGPERLIDTPEPAQVLRAGLREFAELLRDPEGRPLQPDVGLLLDTLGRLVLEQTAEADGLRRQVQELLAEFPLVEMVPEAIIELCHPEFLP